jgi:hypothetical protein
MIANAPTRQSVERLRILPTPAPRDLVRHPAGHYRRDRRGLLLRNRPDPSRTTPQQRLLAWLRDHVHEGIPRAYYKALLGHDLHVSTFAALYVKHFHYGQPDPFTGRVEFNHEAFRWLSRPDELGNIDRERAARLAWGWMEDVGLVSQGKVTTAFRDFEIDQLVAESSAYGDFKYHEVGTDNTAEANTQTALITTTGIARVAGTQVEASAAVYRTVATVTADATETWQEHGIFNASTSGTMMDRSLISPTVAVIANDTVQFTYEITKTAEA